MLLQNLNENPMLVNGRIDHLSVELVKKINDQDLKLHESFLGLIMSEYLAAKQGKDVDIGPVWGGVVGSSSRFLESCFNQSVERLDQALNEMFCTPLTHGFDQGYNIESEESKRHVLSIAIDKLLLLAQSLGVAPVFNPEQGDWRFQAGSIDSILEEIQKKVGFDISAPKFYGGVFGFKSRFGIHTDRTLMSIFIVHEIKKYFSTRTPVYEIGGGSGILAYYMYKAGFKNLTIIDLPEVTLCQGYFLRRNLPDARLITNKDFSPKSLKNCIELYTTEYYFEAKNKWKLVVNVDSLPEMPKIIAEKYISKAYDMGASLFSINQEASARTECGEQNNVNHICSSYSNYQSVLRAPFWMRKGYVLEIFKKKLFLNISSNSNLSQIEP